MTTYSETSIFICFLSVFIATIAIFSTLDPAMAGYPGI